MLLKFERAAASLQPRSAKYVFGIPQGRFYADASQRRRKRARCWRGCCWKNLILLMDEPTQPPDIRKWLKSAQVGKAIIVVGHDRAFLDAVANRVLEIIGHIDATAATTAYDHNADRRRSKWRSRQQRRSPKPRITSAADGRAQRRKGHNASWARRRLDSPSRCVIDLQTTLRM